jgi:hypothetical protein
MFLHEHEKNKDKWSFGVGTMMESEFWSIFGAIEE